MKIFIFHASAGHGHQKAAEVLAKAFLKRGLKPEDVRVIDALDLAPFVFRKSYPAIYFHSVKNIPHVWGWFYEMFDLPVTAWLKPFRHFFNFLHGQKLLQLVKKEKPDVIICAHFFTAELFSSAKAKGKIQAKIITLITDFLPHSFWVNPGTDIYWVMGEDASRALQKRGIPKEKIRTGGIPVEDAFKPAGRKAEILSKFKFETGRLTLLLTSGSFGLGPHAEILKELESFKDKVQCFMVCGKNAGLQQSLEKISFSYPIRIFGFVDFMPDLMEASDLIVAKTGGLTTCESLAKGIPLIVLEPIPGQETRNAEILKERNAAFFMEKPEQIKVIVQSILKDPALIDAKKKEIQKLSKPHAAEDLASFVLQS